MATDLRASPVDTAGQEAPPRPARSRPGFRAELFAFLAVFLLSLLAVGAATVLISGKIARDTALDNAEVAATRLATLVFEPLLPDVLAGEPGHLDSLNHVVDARLTGGEVVLVIVWTPEGEVLYSSEAGLAGEDVTPSADVARALEGEVVSEISEPELGHPAGDPGPFLEVYAPMTVEGRPLAFEAYFSTDMIDRNAALLRGRILPLAVGALAALQLVQIPIVVSLGRRLRRHEIDRAELARQHLAASERERRMIAADVHDGPVQDLAGMSYALGALRSSLSAEQQATADRMLRAVRNAVASLRRLMVEIYPPDLSGPGLTSAVEDLATRLREQGVTVHVSARELPELSTAAAASLYRSAKEGLTNVARHAAASTVWVCLEGTGDIAAPRVRLTVADDGVGLSAGAGAPTSDPVAGSHGHLGLRLVRDRVLEEGGTVTVGQRNGGGTLLEIVIPAGV